MSEYSAQLELSTSFWSNSMQRWKRYAFYTFGVFQVIVFMIAAEKQANAFTGYVDPGSGLLLLQVGGSMLAGALFVLRAKIRKLFRLGDPAQSEEATKEETAADKAGAGPQA